MGYNVIETPSAWPKGRHRRGFCLAAGRARVSPSPVVGIHPPARKRNTLTTSDGTPVEQQRLQERFEQALRRIRFLSLMISILIGVIGGLIAGIIAKALDASALGAVGTGGGGFIAVATLALAVEARINRG